MSPSIFYDGSLLYDFQRHAMTICDIDMYARKPYTNTIGRMWGSSFTIGRQRADHEWHEGCGRGIRWRSDAPQSTIGSRRCPA